jgi:hypothetical protein
MGIALGLAALVALTVPRRGWIAAVAALLAAATSPVVALFLGLAGVALLLSGRVRDGLLIAVPAAVPLALTALLFGDGGWMNISRTDTIRAVVASLVVAALVPLRPVRIAGVLSALGVLAAALIRTPVGLNATRLAVMFTLPVLAGYALADRLAQRLPPTEERRLLPTGEQRLAPTGEQQLVPTGEQQLVLTGERPALLPERNGYIRIIIVLVLLAVACWWQPPVVIGDVRDIGNPTADPAYFAPLRDRLRQETLTGRVEIPPTRDYWEAARMGDVPLARGWLRQADLDRNPLFFTEIPGARGTGVPLTADSYRAWLAEQAVQFVALPDAEFTWSGRPEAELIGAGLPYLTEVWQGTHWRLYAVADPQPIVASQTGHTAASVTFDAAGAGDVPVRIRYHRWLTAAGATVRADGVWTVVTVPAAGRYTLTSGQESITRSMAARDRRVSRR